MSTTRFKVGDKVIFNTTVCENEAAFHNWDKNALDISRQPFGIIKGIEIIKNVPMYKIGCAIDEYDWYWWNDKELSGLYKEPDILDEELFTL